MNNHSEFDSWPVFRHNFLMKKIILFLSLFLMTLPAFAQNDLGIGFMVGIPTGVAARKNLSSANAIDGGLGWSFGSKTKMHLHSDYLFLNPGALYFDTTPLEVYYGIGGRMKFGDDIELGVRAPIGLAYRDQAKPFDVFGEVAPIFDLIPDTGFEIHVAVGFRIYFQ
jgi:hypothetical protein